MNTNAKHYEILAIEPWEIMEKNFTTEEFVAYLKGNIIKYTLRSKGQALTDAEKIKHYSEKLIEVLEKKETDGQHKIKVYKPQVKHKFKVGDRVVIDQGSAEELKGTVKRLPTEGYQGREFHIIELDLEGEGWKANKVTHGVDCDNAWYTPEDNLTLLETEPEGEHKFKVGDRVELIGYDYHFKEGQSKRATIIKISVPYSTNQYLLELDEESKGWHATKSEEGIKCDNAWLVYDHEIKLLEPLKEKSTPALIPNLWYDASLYTVEKLKELLPVGAKVIVTEREDNDRKVNLREEIVREAKVKLVKQRPFSKDTRIGIDNSCLVRRYFKIVEEN